MLYCVIFIKITFMVSPKTLISKHGNTKSLNQPSKHKQNMSLVTVIITLVKNTDTKNKWCQNVATTMSIIMVLSCFIHMEW